jgi:hypothetical protein
MSFRFRFAPWPDVLELFAETAGLTLDLKDVPPGTFNYFDDTKYTPTQALDVLNGYLLPRGYALVRRNRFLVCVNIEKGIPPNLVPKVPLEDLPRRGDNELVTVVFPRKSDDVDRAAEEVGQMLGPQGKVVALKGAGSLLVTDIGSNLRLIDDLLQKSTGAAVFSSSTGPQFVAIPLAHISAREAEQLVRDLFGLPGSRAFEGRGGASPAGAAAIRLTCEPRTNALLVAAAAEQVRLVEQLIQAADVEALPAGEGSAARDFRPAVQLVPLDGADAGRIGRALGALSPRIRVTTSGEAVPADRAARPTPPPPAKSAATDPYRPPAPPAGSDSNGRDADRTPD